MQRCNLSRPSRRRSRNTWCDFSLKPLKICTFSSFSKIRLCDFLTNPMTVFVCDTFKTFVKVALRNETVFLSYQLIFHSFKFNIFNPLCWHSMSDTLTSYSSPFLFHSSLKYFEGGFGKEIPNAILNGTSWDCKIPLTNIFLLLAFLYFMIFPLLSSHLLSFILVDLFLLSKWLKSFATLQYQGDVEH